MTEHVTHVVAKLAENDKRWRNHHQQDWSAKVCHLLKRIETVRDLELDNPSTVLVVLFGFNAKLWQLGNFPEEFVFECKSEG